MSAGIDETPLSGGERGARGTARRLLSSIRDVMAGGGTAQTRLDKIVHLIATEMVAEVCSCYVIRPGDVLELFATVGLNREAVHRTRMSVGEGLVGEVAATGRPLATSSAPSHPNFAYRPETGEDPYSTFMGVPILRSGGVRGVLVIQNRAKREYSEEEVEATATIAMVIAEMVATPERYGDTSGGADLSSESSTGILPSRLTGTVFVRGVAQGQAVLHQPQLTARQMVADDPAVERERLAKALESMNRSIDRLEDLTAGVSEGLEILETYRLFSRDRGWMRKLDSAIEGGLSAEAAVERTLADMRSRMANIHDPYLRERLADFEDLGNRLLQNLAGRASTADAGTLPEGAILVARTLGPAELLDYDYRRLQALVLEKGSTTSHVAIVAKAIGIPVVGQVARLMASVEPMDPIIVDAEHGQIFVRPAEEVQASFAANVEAKRVRRASQAKLVDLPAISKDGVEVELWANAGLLLDVAHAVDLKAEGIGLYRTEIGFMMYGRYPDVATQTGLYGRFFAAAKGRPVTFRTLDIGGDKLLPFFEQPAEENPALGWRAVRIGLDRPQMLAQQIRAILSAGAGQHVRIMFPMVSSIQEMDQLGSLLKEERKRADLNGLPPPARLEFGIMLEVPALLFDLEQVMQRVDFIAIGSNDLAQYLFAADRGLEAVARRYDPLSPPFIAALRLIIGVAKRHDCDVSVCGEMAGRPVDAVVLAALGYRRLSMPPGALLPVKAALRSADLADVERFLVNRSHASDPRSLMSAYLRDVGVDL